MVKDGIAGFVGGVNGNWESINGNLDTMHLEIQSLYSSSVVMIAKPWLLPMLSLSNKS